MSNIQRYDQFGDDGMIPVLNGPWMKWDDHTAALAEVTKERDELRQRLASVAADCDHLQKGIEKLRTL
jgi:hypothetical protein